MYRMIGLMPFKLTQVPHATIFLDLRTLDLYSQSRFRAIRGVQNEKNRWDLLGGFFGLLLLLLDLINILLQLIRRKEGQASTRTHNSNLHILGRLNNLQKCANGEFDGSVLISDIFSSVIVLQELVDSLEALSNANGLPLGEGTARIRLVKLGLAVIESSQQSADTEGANTSTLRVFL